MSTCNRLLLTTVLVSSLFAVIPSAVPAQDSPSAPVAIPSPSRAENKALKKCRDAFSDGVFDVAEARLREFRDAHGKSRLAPQAGYWQIRSLYYLGRFEEASTVATEVLADIKSRSLTPDASSDLESWTRAEILFWQAESELALGDAARAAEAFRAVLSDLQPPATAPTEGTEGGGPPAVEDSDERQALERRARIGLAWALFQLEKDDEARAQLKQVAEADPEGKAGFSAKLVLARDAIARSQWDEARELLNAVAAFEPGKSAPAKLLDSVANLFGGRSKPQLVYEAHYLLGEIALEQNKPEVALEALNAVTDDKRANPRSLLAKSWFATGRALEASRDPLTALPAYEKAFTLTEDDSLRLAAFARFVEAADKGGRRAQAFEKLRAYAREQRQQPRGAAALVAIAEKLEADGERQQAIGILEGLLVADTDEAWQGHANLRMGELYAESNDLHASALKLQAAAQAEDPAVARRAAYALGLVRLRQENPQSAEQAFGRAIANRRDTLAEDARYNQLVALSRGTSAQFNSAAAAFLKDFPATRHRLGVLLLQGGYLEAEGKYDAARQLYQQAMAAAGKPEDRASLLLRLAGLLYSVGDYEQSARLYDQFVREHPDDPRQIEAASSSILSLLAARRLTEAQALESLLTQWRKQPQARLAPRLLFHIAGLYFNRSDYANAQTVFHRVTKEHPNSPLVDRAFLFSGISAINRGEYAEAVKILERVPPQSPLKTEARLLQAKIYNRQMKYEDAITIFGEVLSKERTGELFIEATLRKGDSLFAMGNLSSQNYERAAAAYSAVLNSGQGSPAQRNEAGFRRAKCLERLGRERDALALYLDVLNGRLANADSTTAPQLRNTETMPSEATATESNAPSTPNAASATASSPSSAATSPEDPDADQPVELFWRSKAGLEAARLREAEGNWQAVLRIYETLAGLGGPNRQEYENLISQIRRDQYLYE